jgi:hypothetical protein
MRISFFDIHLKLGTMYIIEIVFHGARNFVTVFITSNSALSEVKSISLILIEICTNELYVPNEISPFRYQTKNCLLFPYLPYALYSLGRHVFSLVQSGNLSQYHQYVAKRNVKILACELESTVPTLCITRYRSLIYGKVTFLELVIKCNIMLCDE